MKLVRNIFQKFIKLGGDALKHFQTPFRNGVVNKTDDVARLLAGSDDALKYGYDVVLRNGDDVARALVSTGDDAARMIASSSDDAARMVATSGDNVMCSAVNAKKPPVPSVPTTTVKPPKPQSPIDKKIASIQERLKAPREAYQAENKAFRAMQQAHIDKFNAYVDDFANKYKDLVGKLDEATDPKEIANIKKQIAKLETQAEKAMKQRLEKLGTLSPSEIQAKIKEAKNLAETRVANLTYASATSNGARAQAEKLIAEVAQEINAYGRDMTPEQIEKIITMKLRKIEEFVSKQGDTKKQLEGLQSLLGLQSGKIALKVGGTNLPLELDFVPNDEIVKLCQGKKPQEALEYYRTLQTKIKTAITKIKHADASDANGYVQFVEQPINIPIKDASKSKELTWLEQQLKEKREMLQAEVLHEGQKNNCIVAIG